MRPHISAVGSAYCCPVAFDVAGVRIGGLTGIFNRKHYQMGHYEAPPYSDDDMRSAYHVRELEVRLVMPLHPSEVILLEGSCRVSQRT